MSGEWDRDGGMSPFTPFWKAELTDLLDGYENGESGRDWERERETRRSQSPRQRNRDDRSPRRYLSFIYHHR